MQVIIIEETENFISGLDEKQAAKCKRYIELLMYSGHELRGPYSKNILPGIFELRVGGAQNIRLIYTFDNGIAILFHGFMKKTNQIGTYEINAIKAKYRLLHL